MAQETLTLDALPTWQQTMITLPDGTQPQARYNDCGETCVAMITAAVDGAPVGPDSVRANLRADADGQALTTARDLVAGLAFYSVRAHVETLAAAAAWALIEHVTVGARPVIMLGTWPTPGGALHWMIAISVAGDRLNYINPWSGAKSWIDQEQFTADYEGDLVVVDQHCHYDMRERSIPF